MGRTETNAHLDSSNAELHDVLEVAAERGPVREATPEGETPTFDPHDFNHAAVAKAIGLLHRRQGHYDADVDSGLPREQAYALRRELYGMLNEAQ
jgi:hypothetical protein